MKEKMPQLVSGRVVVQQDSVNPHMGTGTEKKLS